MGCQVRAAPGVREVLVTGLRPDTLYRVRVHAADSDHASDEVTIHVARITISNSTFCV